MRRTMLVAAACCTILIGSPAAAQPLVSVGDVTVNFGDIDVFEDVLEHITVLR
ncbi:hypothetical protein LWC34_50990 [Kibdelosporangium philippinense]|uniref:ABC transporter substrate-binding protein n=1 Tax=Kibdelosporangium philippinense TaxID=211113 RepID=A0ABS8ZU11_9PSEU|nr:hypothetical protein [Kibdelosporangium philippinense]MCE7011079.1 hypothetical protein [Kibdelosporangium philippinense]